MQEVKTERTIESVNKEYTSAAAMAGDRQFKIEMMAAEVRELHQKMASLSKEHSDLTKVEAARIESIQAGTH